VAKPGQAVRLLKGVGKAASGDRAVMGSASEATGLDCHEKPLSDEPKVPVPQTDTGGPVEDTKANGKTLVKELGNLTP